MASVYFEFSAIFIYKGILSIQYFNFFLISITNYLSSMLVYYLKDLIHIHHQNKLVIIVGSLKTFNFYDNYFKITHV